MIFTIVLVLGLACSASALFPIYVASTTSTATLTTAGAASVLAGVGLVKLAAVAGLAIASSASKSRRDVSAQTLNRETDILFNVVAFNEPDMCIRRLMCDLATGEMEDSENKIMLSLFKDGEEVSKKSAKFAFAQAVKLGRDAKKIEQCEMVFRCPINGAALEQLIAKS